MEISVQMPKKNEQQTKSEYMRTLHDTHSTHNTNTNETKTQSLQRLQNTSQNNQIHPENSYDKIPETSKQLNTKKNDKNNEDAHYNKIRKFTGTKSWMATSMAGSFAKTIPFLSDNAAGALLQGVTKSVGASKKGAKSLSRRKYQNELGVAGRADQFGRTLSNVGRLSYSANLLGSLGSLATGIGSVSPTSSTTSSLFKTLGGPASLGLMLPGLIGSIASNKKMKKITATKKQPEKIEKQYSKASGLDAFYKRLRSEDQLSPFQSLQYLLLSYIESHTSSIPAIYASIDKNEQVKEKGPKGFKDSYGRKTGLKAFKDDNSLDKESIFNKMEDSLNAILGKYDPINQISNFVFGGKLPQNYLNQLKKGKPLTGKELKEETKSIRNLGTGKSQYRLMDIGSLNLISSGQSYEEKMLALSSGQYDLIRFIAQESITIRRHGFGIDTNKFAKPIQEGGTFGRVINSVDNFLSNIPAVSVLYNIGKDLLTFHKKGSSFIKGMFDKSMNVLFGEKFRRFQDQKEVDKELGYDKSLQQRSQEFIADGLPTLLEKVRSTLVQQLETQHNIFSAAKHQYELLHGYYTGQQTQFNYAKTLSDDVKQERIWDSKEAKMLTAEGYQMAQEKRQQQRQYLRENAFSKSLVGILGLNLTKKETLEERMTRVLTPFNKISNKWIKF